MHLSNSSIQQNKRPFANEDKFRLTVKKFQINMVRQQQLKKQNAEHKTKLRNEWLQKIKIIPPKLNAQDKQLFFRRTKHIQSCRFSMFRHNYVDKDNAIDNDERNFTFKFISNKHGNKYDQSNLLTRNVGQSKTVYKDFNLYEEKPRFSTLRCRKFKKNWKIAYRKDQTNIMQFALQMPPNTFGQTQPISATPLHQKQKQNQIYKNSQGMINPSQRNLTRNKIMYRKLLKENKQNSFQFRQSFMKSQSKKKDVRKQKISINLNQRNFEST